MLFHWSWRGWWRCKRLFVVISTKHLVQERFVVLYRSRRRGNDILSWFVDLIMLFVMLQYVHGGGMKLSSNLETITSS
jgi:hypothetical protein